MICYNDKNNIKEYIEILNKEFDKKKFIKEEFKKYIQNYGFKKNPNFYNYSEFFQYIKNNNKFNDLEKLYLSNNIDESLHSKFNFYLPKIKTTPKSFYYAI